MRLALRIREVLSRVRRAKCILTPTYHLTLTVTSALPQTLTHTGAQEQVQVQRPQPHQACQPCHAARVAAQRTGHTQAGTSALKSWVRPHSREALPPGAFRAKQALCASWSLTSIGSMLLGLGFVLHEV